MSNNYNCKFVNLTNHPSIQWSQMQIDAAKRYGEITDLPFPAVKPDADEQIVGEMAKKLIVQVMALCPAAVCCQGEMTLTYKVVSLLKEKGICALAASSAREVVEEVAPDGTTHKTAVFRFCRFREY